MRAPNKINYCPATAGLYVGSRGLQPTVINKEDKSATGNFIHYSISLARIDKSIFETNPLTPIHKINLCPAPAGLNIGSRGLQSTMINKEDKSATDNFIRYSISLAHIDKFVLKNNYEHTLRHASINLF
jgi:hypothetical protein